jgi:tetratricopeptide (TPR) repeat protein
VLTPQLAKVFAEGRKGFQFDIWRVPFAGGSGGLPEAVVGASGNGRSNYFPKLSPDGRWLVFCQAANFMLLQRDSELYIMPAGGGAARRMRCNESGRMNSWHSWSPNGRWLVYSTKVRGPYTQLALAHVDGNGQDAAPVLLEQADFAGRACNIPEFVNLPPGAAMAIEERFLDHHHFMRQGQVLLSAGEAEASVPLFEKAVALNGDDHEARLRLAATLSQLGRTEAADRQFATLLERLAGDAKAPARQRFDAHGHAASHARACGRRAEATEHYRMALAIVPGDLDIRLLLGLSLAEAGDLPGAAGEFGKALDAHGDSALAHLWLAEALSGQQKREEALSHYRKALEGKAGNREDWLLVLRRTARVAEVKDALRVSLERYAREYPDCAEARAMMEAMTSRTR